MASAWPLGGLGLEEWKAGFPSLDVASAESILGPTVSTPAAWEFELILESGLIHGSPTALSWDSDPSSSFSNLDLQAQEKLLLFPICISDLTFCFVLFCFLSLIMQKQPGK